MRDGTLLALGSVAALAAVAAGTRGSASTAPWRIHGTIWPREDAHLLVSEAYHEDLDVDDPDIDKAMDGLVRVLGALRFPLRVWRGLRLEPGTRARPQASGHWTWSRPIAEQFAWGRGDCAGPLEGVPALLVGVVPTARDVFWDETMDLFLRFSQLATPTCLINENEIVARRIEEIRVLRPPLPWTVRKPG